MFDRGLALILLLGALLPAGAGAQSLANRLAGHPSPYLALHGDDPVAWQEWNQATIERARRENKLLFVSIGYFACHWCHVMQRESYRQQGIAVQLNRDFIPVKVDRELHGGLDEALQAFSSRLIGIAGWPLNAFVTPEGYPVFVVLYTPPQAFSGVLAQIAARWTNEPDTIRTLARQAAPASAAAPQSVPLTPARSEQAWRLLLDAAWREADSLHGGFGAVAKFPMVPQLRALLERQATQPDARLDEFLRHTLDQMAARGLRDHVGGGFFRYTIDPGWDTPHFEKMLSDNAQLAMLYLQAAQVLREPRYRAIARGTLDFMLRDLTGPDGGFYSSTSAVDGKGREGAYYLWEPQALQRRLSPAAYAAARRVWQLDRPRTFEYGYLPAEYATPTPAERQLLAKAMATLGKDRQARRLPRDVKQNAGVNGLALSAFSQAMQLDPAYRRAADRLQHFLLTRLQRDRRLLKSMAAGKPIEGAELEDYAFVVQGLLDHADAAGNASSRTAATRLARVAWEGFRTASGWRHESASLLATVVPAPGQPDGAQYSPADSLILASLRLPDPELKRWARAAAVWHVPDIAHDPLFWSTRVRVLATLN